MVSRVTGARYTYEGPTLSLVGKTCRISITHQFGRFANPDMVAVIFDHDPTRDRVVDVNNLTAEGMKPMKNFKTLVADATTKLLAVLTGDSPKEQAVRKLGVAAELVRIGEAAKKKAKTELAALGVIGSEYATGSEIVFDSERYRVVAETKAASTRFDQASVEQALISEGVSAASRRRIIAAGVVANKAATSFKVEAK